MTYYRIKDWEDYFENNRTRELKNMAWVPIPNKMDGDGYTQIFEHKQGVEIFAIWILCVEVASRCDPRGTLMRDAEKEHDFASLSRITRAPAKTFETALPFLAQIGWLEQVTINPAGECEIIAPECGSTRVRVRRTEGNGTEGKEYTDDFIRFWEAYPNKVGKKKAFSAWKKATDKPDIETLIKVIDDHKESDAWTKEHGAFIPHPATWLNAGRWDDVIQKEEEEGRYGPSVR